MWALSQADEVSPELCHAHCLRIKAASTRRPVTLQLFDLIEYFYFTQNANRIQI
jgi:hypothetical protein